MHRVEFGQDRTRLRIALVGRPNVGKSTLFNRLAGQKLALVDDTPGVTRDFREALGKLSDLRFTVIDTAGLDSVSHESSELALRIRHQTERAIAAAEILLFMIDARVGVTLLDREVAAQLRQANIPVVLVANKAESKAASDGLYETYELGLGEPVALSAEHGEGMADLYAAIAPLLHQIAKKLAADQAESAAGGVEIIEWRESSERNNSETDSEIDEIDDADLAFDDDSVSDAELDALIFDQEILAQELAVIESEGLARNSPEKPLQMAIIGRPNVGKSTLVNHLLGEERLLVGPEAGLTRDSIAVPFRYQNNYIRLIDTAGLRRKSSISTKVEKLAVADTLRAVRFAEVVVLVIDALVGFDKQDLTIAGLVEKEGRALVIAINKWDAVAGSDKPIILQAVRDRLQESLSQLRGIPLETISAMSGLRLNDLVEQAVAQERVWSRRATTADINRWLKAAVGQHPPPLVMGRPLRLRYGTQIKSRPPTIALFTSRPQDLPDSYQRYLVGSFRSHFGLDGVPIRMILRKGKNPYSTIGKRRSLLKFQNKDR